MDWLNDFAAKHGVFSAMMLIILMWSLLIGGIVIVLYLAQKLKLRIRARGITIDPDDSHEGKKKAQKPSKDKPTVSIKHSDCPLRSDINLFIKKTQDFSFSVYELEGVKLIRLCMNYAENQLNIYIQDLRRSFESTVTGEQRDKDLRVWFFSSVLWDVFYNNVVFLRESFRKMDFSLSGDEWVMHRDDILDSLQTETQSIIDGYLSNRRIDPNSTGAMVSSTIVSPNFREVWKKILEHGRVISKQIEMEIDDLEKGFLKEINDIIDGNDRGVIEVKGR